MNDEKKDEKEADELSPTSVVALEETKSKHEESASTAEFYGLNFANQVKCTCCCGKIPVSEKNYLLGLFTIINVFLFADQNLLAPNLSVLAEEFNMTDDERDQYLGGYISLGFFAIGGIVAMIVGYLADSFNRKIVFALTVCIGEISCLLTYWVPMTSKQDFWTGLWLTRAITGVAVGGALPIQFSILGDIFTEKDRGKAVAFFSIANGIGLGAGQYVANALSPDFRTPFLLVSIPSFILVAIFLKTTTEPKRGQAEKLVEGKEEILQNDHKISFEKLKLLFTTPTAALIILQGLPGTLPWGVIQIFLNDFLLEEKENDKIEAGNVILIFGLFSAVSTILGGYLGDKFIESRPLMLPLIAAGTTFFAPFGMVALLRGDDYSFGLNVLLTIPTGLLASIAGPILKGLLLHVTLPETRGTAFAFQSLLDELGKGLGPFFISAIINAASTREDGLVIGILGWLPASVVMGSICFFLKKDTRRYNEAMEEAYGVGPDNLSI